MTEYGSISDEIVQEDEELPSYTISDILDMIGFGKFHYVICFIGIIGFLGDGSEIMLLSLLPLVIKSEWDISQNESYFLTSNVFIGMILSYTISGYVASKIGRKKVIVISNITLCIASLVSVLSQNITTMLVSRFFVGFSYGGAWIFKTYLTEFMPMNFRLWALYIISFGYIGGIFYTTLMAFLFVNSFSWRIWLMASMMPSFVFFLLSFFLYETPFYLLQKEKVMDSTRCLKRIAEINKAVIPLDFNLKKSSEADSSTISQFFSRKYLKINFIQIFILITSGICYYGFILLSNSLFVSSNEPSKLTLNDGLITQAAFKDILVTTSFEIPGVILTFMCSHFIGRKFTFISFFGLITISYLIMMFIKVKIGGIILTAIIRSLNTMPSNLCLNYVPEFYSTETRSFASGFLTMFYRIGGLLSPFVIGFFHSDVFNLFLFYTVCTFFCVLCSFGYVETKNRPTE